MGFALFPPVRGVRLINNREQLLKRLALDAVGHLLRSCNDDEECAALFHAMADMADHFRGQHVIAEISQDDHIKHAPLVTCQGERASLGFAKGTRGGCRGQVDGRQSVDEVGLHQHKLEVDGLVASVKEVPEVTIFPARLVVDQEYIRPVIGNIDIGGPLIVLFEGLTLHGVNDDAIAA